MTAKISCSTLMLVLLCLLFAAAPCHAQSNPVVNTPDLPPLPDSWDFPDDPPGLDGFPDPPLPDPFDDIPEPPWDIPDFPGPFDDIPWPEPPPFPDDPFGDELPFPSLFGIDAGEQLGYSPLQFKPEPLPLPFYPRFGSDVHSTAMGLPACTSDQDTRLLVVAPKANKLNVVGTCPHRMLARISVGVEPVAVKANPAGTLVLVSNTSGGSVSLVDIGTYTVLANIPLPTVNGIPATPSAIAFSPDGFKAYIANHSDIAGAVFVLDMNSRMVMSTLSPGAFPAGLAVTPDGTELWVTCRGNSTVHVYDTLTNIEIKSIPEVEPLGIAFSPNGMRAYIAVAPDTGPGSLKVLDTSSFAEIASIQVGNLPSTVLVSPTGRFIFVNNLQSSFVSKIDAAHNVVLHNLKTRAPWRVMMMRR